MHRLYAHFAGESFTSTADVIDAGHVAIADPLVHGRDVRMMLFRDVVGPRGDVGTLAVMIALDDDLPSRPPAVAPDRQTWVDDDRVAIGWESLFPPGHHVLRRLRQADGVAVMLGGSAWLLPRLDLAPPFKPAKGAYYTPADEPIDDDMRAHELCLEVLHGLREGGDAWQRGEFPLGSMELLEFALGRNYRGTPKLWRALGLFNDEFLLGVAVLSIAGIAADLAARLPQILKGESWLARM